MGAYGEVSWERMIRAVEKVRERLLRAISALEKAGISYAVAGDHAVAAWVAQVDESAVRNPVDVEIVIRREDLSSASKAFGDVGFVHAKISNAEMFLDHVGGKPRDAVRLIFAGEKAKPDDLLPAPDISETERSFAFQVLSLKPLVRMNLTSYRILDRVHLRDLIDVGLIDSTWPARFPPPLAGRLQELLDNPDG